MCANLRRAGARNAHRAFAAYTIGETPEPEFDTALAVLTHPDTLYDASHIACHASCAQGTALLTPYTKGFVPCTDVDWGCHKRWGGSSSSSLKLEGSSSRPKQPLCRCGLNEKTSTCLLLLVNLLRVTRHASRASHVSLFKLFVYSSLALGPPHEALRPFSLVPIPLCTNGTQCGPLWYVSFPPTIDAQMGASPSFYTPHPVSCEDDVSPWHPQL